HPVASRDGSRSASACGRPGLCVRAGRVAFSSSASADLLLHERTTSSAPGSAYPRRARGVEIYIDAGICPARSRSGGKYGAVGLVPAAARPRDLRLGGGDPRDREAERRAGNVRQPRVMEELDRLGVAAVFAADSEFQTRVCLATDPRGESYEPADARLVDRLE